MTRFDMDDVAAATEVVEAVGHGNTFLRHMHTVRNFKKEIIFRDQARKGWQATLSTAMVPEAKAVAKRILAEHEVPDVAPDVAERGDAIVAEHMRTLGA